MANRYAANKGNPWRVESNDRLCGGRTVYVTVERDGMTYRYELLATKIKSSAPALEFIVQPPVREMHILDKIKAERLARQHIQEIRAAEIAEQNAVIAAARAVDERIMQARNKPIGKPYKSTVRRG